MPARRKDADSRRFLDEFPKVRISRFRALGIVDPSRDWAKIIFPNGKEKLIYTYHRKLNYGGGWSLFVCPGCSKRTPNLYLIDDAPKCSRCCAKINIHHRSSLGFGRADRIAARNVALDALIHKLESGERQRIKTFASWGGKAQQVYNSRRLTARMRRNMVACRLNQIASAHGDYPGRKGVKAYTPNTQVAQAFDLKPIWRAKTPEQLEQALDNAQCVMLDAIHGDSKQQRLAAARAILKSRQAAVVQ